MSLGKTIRLKRVLNDPTHTSVICALDHGMTSPVFLDPLADIRARVTEAVLGGGDPGHAPGQHEHVRAAG